MSIEPSTWEVSSGVLLCCHIGVYASTRTGVVAGPRPSRLPLTEWRMKLWDFSNTTNPRMNSQKKLEPLRE